MTPKAVKVLLSFLKSVISGSTQNSLLIRIQYVELTGGGDETVVGSLTLPNEVILLPCDFDPHGRYRRMRLIKIPLPQRVIGLYGTRWRNLPNLCE
jgi:hypothetical protein